MSRSHKYAVGMMALAGIMWAGTCQASKLKKARFTIQTPKGCDVPVRNRALLPSHDRVYLWVELHDVRAGDRYEYRWYDPSGKPHYSKTFTRPKDAARACTFNWIKIAGQAAANLQGLWKVQLYHNGQKVLTKRVRLLEDLIRFQRGTVPIILSAPHGGHLGIEGVPERSRSDATTSTDTRTLEVTEAAAHRFAILKGRRPTVVAAKMDRKYLDLNREHRWSRPFKTSQGLEDPKALPYYNAYHDTLKAMVAEAKAKWRKPLLIDIHGQATDRKTIHRGTADGATLATLTNKTLLRPTGLFGALRGLGYTIYPTVDGAPEATSFNGGFIVRNYGGAGDSALDAVQIEIGRHLRMKYNWKSVANALGRAIKIHYDHHIK